MRMEKYRALSPRSRVLRGLAALSVAGLLVTACSSESTPSPESTAAGSQTFTYAIPGEVTSLDTQNTQSVSNKFVDGIRESTLLQYDVPADCSPTDVAGLSMKTTKLVDSYEVSEDGKTISFVLNEGVLSQAGNELTSADVVYSIDRVADIGTTGKFLFFTAGGFDTENPITVTGDYTFDLNVANPTSLSTQVLSLMWMEILDSKTVQEHATADDPWSKNFLDDNVADFGPWALESFEPGVSTVYKRNPNAQTEGNIERVIVRTIADSSTRSQLMQTGEVDRAELLSFTEYEALQQVEDIRVSLCSSVSRTFLGLNWEDPAFADVDVRRAISLALDRDALTQSVYGDFAAPAKFGTHAATAPNTGSSSYEYNVEEAKALLKKAGYENGLSFELSYSPENPANGESLAVFIRQQLAEVGIDVTLAPIGSVTDYRAALAAGLQAYLYSETPVVPDPGYSYLQQHGGPSAQNFSRIVSADLDERATAVSQSEPGTPERAEAVDAFSELVDTEVPIVYLVDMIAPMANRTCADSAPNSAVLTYPMLDDIVLSC